MGVYPSKNGILVKHIKYGLCYIGRNLKERFSLHSLKDGKRLTQNAKREDFKILTRISWRTQFLSKSIRGSPWVNFYELRNMKTKTWKDKRAGLSENELRQTALDIRNDLIGIHKVVQSVATRIYTVLKNYFDCKARLPKRKVENKYRSFTSPQSVLKIRGRVVKRDSRAARRQILHLADEEDRPKMVGLCPRTKVKTSAEQEPLLSLRWQVRASKREATGLNQWCHHVFYVN